MVLHCLETKPFLKVGSLEVDLESLRKGFLEEEECRKEIWNYIQYRESLLKWPSNQLSSYSTRPVQHPLASANQEAM